MTTKEMKMGIVKTIFSVPELTLVEWQELYHKHPKGGNVATSSISGWKSGKQSMSLYYMNSFLRILCDSPIMQEYWKDIKLAVLAYLGIQKKYKVYYQLLECEFEEFAKYVLNQLTVEKAVSLRLVGEVVSATHVLELFSKRLEDLRPQFEFENNRPTDKLIATFHFDGGDYKVAAGFFFGDIPEETMIERCRHFYETSEGCTARFVFLTIGAPEELCARISDEYHIVLTEISAGDREEGVPAADVYADCAFKKLREVLIMVEKCRKIRQEEMES